MSEQLKEFVLGLLEGRTSPLWLASLGSSIPPELAPEGKLGDELKAIDGLALARDKKRPQRVAVCREEDKEDVEKIIRGEVTPENAPDPYWHKQIYFSIISAFTVATDQDEKVLIDGAKPYKFRVLSKAEDALDDQILIPDELRRPGVDYTKDDLLYDNIQKWAQLNGIPYESLLRPSAKVVIAGEFGNESANALSRLIALQKQDVRDKLLIPADIAELLMKYK